jgi:hypothetical protein
MDNFFGNIDNQAIETLHIMGNGWIYAFFIVGACLLAASWLVNWQVRRVQRIMASQAEHENAPGAGSDSTTGETPRG